MTQPSPARVARLTKTAGFSSWKCLGCHRSLLSMMAVDEHLTPKQAWMTDAVAIPEGGKLIKGEYDGYGKVGSKRLNYQDNISCWHEACWKKSGSPGYTRPSQNADDQGWFFEPRKYLSASPTSRDTAPPEHLKRPEDEGEDMSRWSDHQKIRKELMWKFEVKDPKVIWESIMVGLEGNRTSQYHFFVLWQDKDTGEYVGGNAYGSFGNSPKSVLLMRDADQGKVEKKVKSKMRSKSRKYAPKDELIPNGWRPRWGSLELASASRVAELASTRTAGGPPSGMFASARAASKKTTLSAELKLKDGTEYAKGSRAEVFFSERNPSMSEVEIEGRKIKLRTVSLHKYLRGFPKPPSTRALQKMDSEASGPTVSGVRNVEMDGYGPDGSPSWMLAMGLI